MALCRTAAVRGAAGGGGGCVGFMVAATGQHVGKTTSCLGLVAGAVSQHRSDRVAYMKPVGQQWVEVDGGADGRMRVDKDCILFKEHFRLACAYRAMSSVVIPKGFTRDYLDGKTAGLEGNKEQILSDYAELSGSSDVVVVEGTGHAGVGAVVELHNAKVAQILGIPAVLVGSGGIGSSIDQLLLSKTLFEHHDVKIKGIIVNKVIPEKCEMVERYVRRVVEDRWGVPLLGVVPFNKTLDQPTMNDFSLLFKAGFIAGEEHKLRRIGDVQLIATSLDAFTEQSMYRLPNQLYVVPSARADILLAIIAELKTVGKASGKGLILTGEYPPQEHVLEQLRRETIPTIHIPKLKSHDVCTRIATFTAKIRMEDSEKIQKAIDVITQAIDMKTLLS